MSDDVFISYARSVDAGHARAVRDCLVDRSISVFLDEGDIAPGAPFPDELTEALLGSKMVVVFASEPYFGSPWCVAEFNVAVAVREADQDAPLDHVVVAWSKDTDATRLVARLPPALATASAPAADDAARLADVVIGRLSGRHQPLRELVPADSRVLRLIREGGTIPSAGSLAAVRGSIEELPDSLGERFVGRDFALWQVFNALEAGRGDEGAPRSVLLQGGGGTGKTQLAAEYVWRYGRRFYPGGIVWIDAGEEELLGAQFEDVLAAFDGAAGDDDPGRAVSRCMSRVAADGAVLWVVDKVPESPLPIEDLCPAMRYVSLLCTSRRTGLKRIDHTIDVTPLTGEAGIDMLTSGAVDREALPDSQWAHIAGWVGGLPLALRILNVSLEDHYVTPQEVFDTTLRQEPAAALDREVEDDYVRGVAQTLAISYEHLLQEPALAEAAHVIARLAPVPTSLTALASTRVLASLTKRSWIQRTDPKRAADLEPRWAMHGLTASYLRCRSGAPDREFAAVLRWLREVQPRSRPMTLHLMKLTRDLVDWLLDSEPDSSEAVNEGVRLGNELVFHDQVDADEAGSIRVLGANLLGVLGATEPAVDVFRHVYPTADESTIAAMCDALRGMSYSRGAAELLAEMLSDPRPTVAAHALSAADQSKCADVLAVAALDAVMNLRRDDQPGYQNLFTEMPHVLPSALERLLDYLDGGAPAERRIALRLVGRLLGEYRDQLEDGPFGYRACGERLIACAEHEPADDVALAAAGELGLLDDEEIYDELAAALRLGEPDVTDRTIGLIGEYLSEATRPGALRNVSMQWLDDGGLMLSMSGVGAKPRRPERYAPLVRLAIEEADRRDAALRELMRTDDGKLALVDAVADLVDAGENAVVLALAGSVHEREPDLPSPYWWRGQVRARGSDFDGAIADFTMVLELTPAFVEARYQRALMFGRSGQVDRALDDLGIVLDHDPDDVRALFDRGLGRYQTGDQEGAIEDLDRLIDLTPDEPMPRHVKAGALLNAQRLDEALAAEDGAIALDDSVAEYWLFRANINHELGRADAALADAERACILDPTDDRAVTWRDHLRAATDQR